MPALRDGLHSSAGEPAGIPSFLDALFGPHRRWKLEAECAKPEHDKLKWVTRRGTLQEDLGRRRTLYKLAMARSSIRSARDIAAYASEKIADEGHALWLPLQDALVVTYARPFTANKPFGPLASRWSRVQQ